MRNLITAAFAGLLLGGAALARPAPAEPSQYCYKVSVDMLPSGGLAALPWIEKIRTLRAECAQGSVVSIPAEEIAVIAEICDWNKAVVRNDRDILCAMR